MKTLSKDTIVIHPELADKLKEKVYEVFKTRYKKTKLTGNHLNEQIQILIKNRYGLKKPYKIHTYHTTIHGTKEIAVHKESFSLLLIFCHFITDPFNVPHTEDFSGHSMPDYKINDEDISHPLRKLFSSNPHNLVKALLNHVKTCLRKNENEEPDKNTLDGELYTAINRQFAAWDLTAEKNYACYYSTGDEAPGAWLMTVRKNWAEINLTIFKPLEKTLTGAVISQASNKSDPNRGNIFLSFYDDKTQLYKLFTLRGDSARVSDSTTLMGHYSTGSDDEYDPVSGKVILKLIDNDAKIGELRAGSVPTELVQELSNQFLKIKNSSGNVDRQTLEDIKGVYRAYWFQAVGDQVTAREMAVEILPTGRIQIRDYESPTLNGYINLLDHNKALRCAFEPAPDGYNFRIQMILDVSHSKANVFDGVYSGQVMGWKDIIAGKIRLYRSTNEFEKITPKALHLDEIVTGFKRGNEIMDFYWGNSRIKGLSSNHYLTPDYSIFIRKFQEINLALSETTNVDSRVPGTYILYRIDSLRKYINLYKLTIHENGTVEYRIKTDKEHRYQGVFRTQENCLIIHITGKDGKAYEALYIFYFAGKQKGDFLILTGVYSSIATHGGAALAGRAALEYVEEYPDDVDHIPVFSEAYYKLVESKPRHMIENLTGFAENSIRSPRKTDWFSRNIHYDQVFFNHACHHKALNNKLKKDYLQFAFDHGYADINKLREELTTPNALSSIEKDVKIKVTGEKFEVTIQYASETNSELKRFTGVVKNKYPIGKADEEPSPL